MNSTPSSPVESCPFCLDTIVDPLELNCGHRYCRACLTIWFTTKVNEKITKLSCETCKFPVDSRVLESILPRETFEKFSRFDLDRVLEAEFNLFYCPNKDCLNTVAAPYGSKYVECPWCKKEYCMTCKVNWHQGITCAKYQECAEKNKDASSLTLTFLRREGAKQCPKCNIWIEKNGGCDHMTCRKCNYQFWWSTLEPYPNGRSTSMPTGNPLWAGRQFEPPIVPRLNAPVNFINSSFTFGQASRIVSEFRANSLQDGKRPAAVQGENKEDGKGFSNYNQVCNLFVKMTDKDRSRFIRQVVKLSEGLYTRERMNLMNLSQLKALCRRNNLQICENKEVLIETILIYKLLNLP